MGIINVTPDSFSGDGVLAAGHGDAADDGPIERAVASARQMVADGADILDVGGESTRPGHEPVDGRRGARTRRPGDRGPPRRTPGHADQRRHHEGLPWPKRRSAAGADLINDVWGVGADDDAPAPGGHRAQVPLVVMHNRETPQYRRLLPEIVDDLRAALDRAVRLGVAWDDLIVDPGFGFGKTAEHNLELLRELDQLRMLGRPILARHEPQVDARAGPRPGARRTARGDPGDDRARDRPRRRHRPRPRRPRERPRGPDRRCDHSRRTGGPSPPKEARAERPDRPRRTCGSRAAMASTTTSC